MSIEPVTIEDAEELLQIYEYYVRETAISFEYEVPTVAEFQNRIRTIQKKYPYLKAVEDGKILGYAYANTFKTRKAYSWSVETTIYVKKEERRNGIGRMLYDRLGEELTKMGIQNMNACIVSPIRENLYANDDSIRFHTKMGFSMVGKFHHSGYKFDEWFDMVWMEKMIGDHEGVPAHAFWNEEDTWN